MSIIKSYFFIFLLTSIILTSTGFQTVCGVQRIKNICFLYTNPAENGFHSVIFKSLKSVERMVFNLYLKLAVKNVKYLIPLNAILKYSLNQEQVKLICQKLKITYSYPTIINFQISNYVFKNNSNFISSNGQSNFMEK